MKDNPKLVEMREKDREIKNLMIKYWTNFAKFGHPTPASSDNTTQWLTYGEQKVNTNRIISKSGISKVCIC